MSRVTGSSVVKGFRCSIIGGLAMLFVLPHPIARAGQPGLGPVPPVAPMWSLIDSSLAGATAVSVSPDGARVFVAGPARVGTRYAASIGAYDAVSGEPLWRFRSRRTTAQALPCKLAISPAGSTVFLLDHIGGAGTGADIGTWALNAGTGANRWSARHDGTAHTRDVAGDVTVGPSGGRIYVTGSSTSRGERYEDLVLIAYDARDGTRLWKRLHDGGFRGCQPEDGCYTGFDEGRAVALSEDGATVVAAGAQRFRTLLIAFRSSSGDRLWTMTYAPPGGASGEGTQSWSDAAVSGNDVIVAGVSATDEAGGERPLIGSFDLAGGERNWTSLHVPAGLSYGWWTSMTVAGDGGSLFTTGPVQRTGGSYAVACYDAATGESLWVSDEAGIDRTVDLVLSPDGDTVYAVGHREIGSDTDLEVVGLDASTGVPAWTARHGGATGAWERASAIVMAPDGGSIFAVGATGASYEARSTLIVAFETN